MLVSATYLRKRKQIVENAETVLTGERYTQDSRESPEIPHGGGWQCMEAKLQVVVTCSVELRASCTLVGAICHFRFKATSLSQIQRTMLIPSHCSTPDINEDKCII